MGRKDGCGACRKDIEVKSKLLSERRLPENNEKLPFAFFFCLSKKTS